MLAQVPHFHFFRDQHLRRVFFVSIWTPSVWVRVKVLFMGLLSRFIVSFTTSWLGCFFFCVFFFKEKTLRVSHLRSEVSADDGLVVELGKDLPEDLFIHLTTFPRVESRRGVEVHVTDHQRETPRGGAHSVTLRRGKVEGRQGHWVIMSPHKPHNGEFTENASTHYHEGCKILINSLIVSCLTLSID